MAEIVGVVGAGVMGRGIAQLFAQSGHEVRLFDAVPDAAAKARDFVLGMLDRQVVKGTIDAAKREAIAGRLTIAAEMSGLAGCSIIIEAVVEDLSIKQSLFRELEAATGGTAILASNTSSLTVAAIAAACQAPEKVAGLHFFNPVPLMKIAEVIPGILTDAAVVERLAAAVSSTGHRSVVAADQPGFLINHAGRALYTEGLRIVEEGSADYPVVDLIMRESCGFRMGPFELLDLTGLDVSSKVMQSIYDQFQQDPRYRPSALVPPRVAAGLFGRKTGRGFYSYDGDRKVEPVEPTAPAPVGGRLWLGPEVALGDRLALPSVEIVQDPDTADVLLVAPLGDDVSVTVSRLGLDATRTLAVDPLIDAARRQTLMSSPATAAAARDLAHGWLAATGAVTLIGDAAGGVAQRVLSMIVNTGCEIAQRGIARPADIDAAVRIGLGYPEGPLALGDRLGPARILTILERMQALSGDPRYRPSAWLRRRATLGLSLPTS
jgi:3-hydroxybutyryl-CoA dehydrogenase